MSSKNDLISVLIPSYNHDKYIVECIRSIIDQTYQNIELIIIDDGSQDDTHNKINSIQQICEKRFTNFLYIRHDYNKGIIQTESEFLNYARGEFLFKIASDDLVKKNYAIEKMYDFLSSNQDYGLVVCNNDFIDSNSKKCYLDQNGNIFYTKSVSNYDLYLDVLLSNRSDADPNSENFGSYESLLKGNYIPNGLLVRKNVYDKIEPYVLNNILEDWFLVLQIAKFYKIKLIKDVLFSYRRHGSNTSNSKRNMKELIRSTVAAERKILEFSQYKNHKVIAQKFFITKEIKFFFIFKIIKQKNFYQKKIKIYLCGIEVYSKFY